MALELTIDALADGLLSTLRKRKPRLANRADQAIAWLRDIAEPPDGVELKSADGSSYTGVALFERNQVQVMLAVRHPPGPHPERAPVVTPAPQYQRDPLGPDAAHWGRDDLFQR